MELSGEGIIYLLIPESMSDGREYRIRVIGGLLEGKFCLEGICTIVIHAVMDINRHSFRVHASSRPVLQPIVFFSGVTTDTSVG